MDGRIGGVVYRRGGGGGSNLLQSMSFPLTFTYSKSTIETLEKGVKYAQSQQ